MDPLNLIDPPEVIGTSNGHRWVLKFKLVCCLDCGIVRRRDNNNKPCKGKVQIGPRYDIPRDNPFRFGSF